MDISELKKICDKVVSLEKKCGIIMKEADRSSYKIDSKEGHKNFVTTYDKKIEEILKEGLKEIMPEAKFIGEEESEHDYNMEGYSFIVDPIDGTSNFIKDFQESCISIGLIKDNEGIMGVIHDPYRDETYTAIKGRGAFCNGKPIHVSDLPLSRGLVVLGTAPYYDDLHDASFKLMREYFDKCIDVRRCGSAALDMCKVACGRAELYCELKIQAWDVAAGSVIIREAGGTITTASGDELSYDGPTSALAWNNVCEPIFIKE